MTAVARACVWCGSQGQLQIDGRDGRGARSAVCIAAFWAHCSQTSGIPMLAAIAAASAPGSSVPNRNRSPELSRTSTAFVPHTLYNMPRGVLRMHRDERAADGQEDRGGEWSECNLGVSIHEVPLAYWGCDSVAARSRRTPMTSAAAQTRQRLRWQPLVAYSRAEKGRSTTAFARIDRRARS